MTNSPSSLSWSQLIRNAKNAEDSGDFIQARQMLEAAVSQSEKFGAATAFLQDSLENLARFYVRRGLDEQASKLCERLVELGKSKWGPNDQRLVGFLDLQAGCYKRLGTPRLMLAPLTEALRIEEVRESKAETLILRMDALVMLLTELRQMEDVQAMKARIAALKGVPAPVPEPVAVPAAAPPPVLKPAAPAAPPSNTPLVAERKVFVGQLLMRCGLLKYDELNKHLQFAKRLGLPVGQVLVSSGVMTQEQLDATLSVQSLTKDNKLSFEQAAKALNVMFSNNVSLEEALAEAGVSSSGGVENKLGVLLVEAGAMTKEALDLCLSQCSETKNPLGKQLVVGGFVAANVVGEALMIQDQIRAGEVKKDEALARLKKLSTGA